MRRVLASSLVVFACVSGFAMRPAPAQNPAPAAPPPRAQGLAVTFAPVDAERRRQDGAHTYRARQLSLCVERGETPSPFLEPGLFEATFRGLLPLPMRDRLRFRVEGKGLFELHINGQRVLHGTLRPGRPETTAEAIRLQKGDNEVMLRLESSAAGDAQLRVLWSGSEFAFEPIAPEAWQWPADDPAIAASQQLRLGHQLFVDRRCAHCHRPPEPVVSAFSELDQRGPDLRNVGARLQPAFLVEWLKNPRAVHGEATMPRFRAERERDYHDLAAWLLTQGQPLAAVPFPADAADRGAVRFMELGCVACHPAREENVAAATLRSRLPIGYVARKWRPTALEQYLQQPTADHAHARMPDFRLDAADAKALAAYLLAGTAVVATAPPGDAEAGRKLAQRHGCDRCHETTLPESGGRFVELRALHADHGCLGTSDKAPDHGLDATQHAALRAFLPRAIAALPRRAPIDYAMRMLPALRCTQCHAFDGRPSAWAELAQERAADEPLLPEQDPLAQGIPALTWIGAKLQPGWTSRFVTGREPSPRPWLHARMPVFAAHGEGVVTGLVRMHGHPTGDEPAGAADAQLAIHGQRLVKMGEGFGCVQCHAVGSTKPVQVFDRQGINFAVSKTRLRREYFLRWMLDPMRIDPDAKMPKFADSKGKTPFLDVLGGDAARQFEAIWHWFLTLP